MITKFIPCRATILIVLLGTAAPALAQTADADARLRRVEAEVRALQRQVFPGSDGKYFTPQVAPGTAATPAPAAGLPATTPVTDLLTRMEAVEAQLARLTAQNEETANRVAQIEAKLAVLTPPPAAAAPAATTPGAATPAPGPQPGFTAPASAAPAAVAVTTPAPTPRPASAAPAAAPRPPATTPTRPSAARVAAVQKIEKPATGNPGDDSYSYGFRLWEARFFPEAQLQLRTYVDTYPRDPKISYGRNLLGRAYLDNGQPREAAPWFLKNYQSDKRGARAPDSLLYLAESMRQLKDTSRACIALAEFAETYPAEAASRLKAQYDATKAAITCT